MAAFNWCFVWHMCITDGKTILLHVMYGALVEPLHRLMGMVKFLLCMSGAILVDHRHLQLCRITILVDH
jgi:hypothetical protein